MCLFSSTHDLQWTPAACWGLQMFNSCFFLQKQRWDSSSPSSKSIKDLFPQRLLLFLLYQEASFPPQTCTDRTTAIALGWLFFSGWHLALNVGLISFVKYIYVNFNKALQIVYRFLREYLLLNINCTTSGVDSDTVIKQNPVVFFPRFFLFYISIKQAWWKHAEDGVFPVMVSEPISRLEAGFGGRTAAQLQRYAYKLQ